MIRFLTFFLIGLFTILSHSQVKIEKVDLMEMVQDLLITKKNNENMSQVLWLPLEYWEVALAETQLGDEETKQKIISTFNDYTIFSVVNVNVIAGEFKGITSVVTFTGTDKQIYKPIKAEDIPEDVSSLLEGIRPILANMLGQYGKEMQLNVFKKTNPEGNLIAGPLQKGQLILNVNDQEFLYRLPLSSMIAKKICPKDDELFNGNWEYCPWHGKKLIEKQKNK